MIAYRTSYLVNASLIFQSGLQESKVWYVTSSACEQYFQAFAQLIKQ